MKNTNPQNQTRENQINAYFQKAARGFADRLNRNINSKSLRAKKKGFLLVGVIMAFICLKLITGPAQSGASEDVIAIDSLTSPRDVHASKAASELSIIEKYNRMMRYKDLLDKVSEGKYNKNILDSMRQAHPGLEDTVRTFLENYYRR